MEFESRFRSEADCIRYLSEIRWPEGFQCPSCGDESGWRLKRGQWQCRKCRRQTSVLADTIFQDSHLPLTIWFRAMWLITSQKYGISALGLQRSLGLGSYRTAWAMLHKLRRAMVRPDRDRLHGLVEVDETYWGAREKGVTGRLIEKKAIIVVAAEEDGEGIGRIRLRRVDDVTRETLHAFIADSVEPGSTVNTDGLQSYRDLDVHAHRRDVQRKTNQDEHPPQHAHRVIALLKRWLLGTHQGAVSKAYLDFYLDEFTFRFNRRKSASRGKLFYRLAQQAVQVSPSPISSLGKPQHVGSS